MTDQNRTAERVGHPLIAEEQARTILRLEAEVERLREKADAVDATEAVAQRYAQEVKRLKKEVAELEGVLDAVTNGVVIPRGEALS